DDYDSETGNLTIHRIQLTAAPRTGPDELPAQLVHLSRSLESYRGQKPLRVTFGDLSEPSSAHASAALDPPLGGPPADFASVPSCDSADIAVYRRTGLRVTVGDDEETQVLAEPSLADIQRMSAPRDVPPSYYAAASNYVFLL